MTKGMRGSRHHKILFESSRPHKSCSPQLTCLLTSFLDPFSAFSSPVGLYSFVIPGRPGFVDNPSLLTGNACLGKDFFSPQTGLLLCILLVFLSLPSPTIKGSKGILPSWTQNLDSVVRINTQALWTLPVILTRKGFFFCFPLVFPLYSLYFVSLYFESFLIITLFNTITSHQHRLV